MSDRKTCPVCLSSKPHTDFGRHPKSSDGLQTFCRTCFGDMVRRRHADSRQRARAERLSAGTKSCKQCKETKPLAAFQARPQSRDGLLGYCRVCVGAKLVRWRDDKPGERESMAARARSSYERHREARKAAARAWYAANPDKGKAVSRRSEARRRLERWHEVLAHGFRHRAKVKKYGPPDIDGAYLLDLFEQQKGLCYWLGIPMVPSAVNRDPRRPSVDRIDNAKGYVRGNVVLTTMFANMGRSVLDHDSFRTFVTELRQQLK
jgi:hypothetical protein